MRLLLLTIACVQLTGLHLAAYYVLETSAVLGAVIFLLSWGAFIWLCVQANRKNPRARLPKAKKGQDADAAPAGVEEAAPGGS